ncbi:hypothetical protein [Halorhabdus rudnickae]|nr:hypothetical protein [Halorhabdus rudnickae]
MLSLAEFEMTCPLAYVLKEIALDGGIGHRTPVGLGPLNHRRENDE